MKKILSIIFVLTLMVQLLSGCGETNVTSTTQKDQIVKIWSTDSSSKNEWEALASKFNETTGTENGLKVEWTFYSQDYETILETSRQNGTLPEFYTIGNATMMNYIDIGELIPIESLPGGADYLKSEQWKTRQIGGKTYAIPISVTATGLIYNKDLFKEKGIVDEKGEAKAPKTWGEVSEYAKILTDKSKNIYGYAFPMAFNWGYCLEVPFAASFPEERVAMYDYDAKTVEFKNAKPMLEFITGLNKEGVLFPGSENLDNDTARAYFAEGKIGMMTSMSWDVGVLTQQFVATCDWGVADVPVLDESQRHNTFIAPDSGYVIGKSAEKLGLDKAKLILEFLTSVDTRVHFYEKGMKIPTSQKVLDAAKDTSKISQQFQDFSKISANTNYKSIRTPNLKLIGNTKEEVYAKVFVSQVTIDEAIEDLNKRYSNALKDGIDSQAFDISDYKD